MQKKIITTPLSFPIPECLTEGIPDTEDGLDKGGRGRRVKQGAEEAEAWKQARGHGYGGFFLFLIFLARAINKQAFRIRHDAGSCSP